MSCFTAVKYFITTTMYVVCVHIAYFISSYIWQIVENYTRCAYHMSLPSLPRSLAFQCFNLEHNQSGSSCPIYELLRRLGAWMNYQPLERLCRYIPVMAQVVTQWRSMLLYIYKTLCISELWKLLIFTPVLYLI